MLERYSTERLTPSLKIRRWCDFGSSTFSRLSVRPYQPDKFQARLTRAMVGEIGITHMTSTAAIAESNDGCVGEWAGSRGGALAITSIRTGSLRLMQGGVTLRLNPGDIVIRDLQRRWLQDAPEDFSLMTVKVPTRCLDGAFESLKACIMFPLRAGDPRAALLANLIENLGRIAFDGRALPSADPVERLLRAALEISFAHRPGKSAVCNGSLPAHVSSYLDEHLADPELSVAGLAQDLNLNIRSVQRMFRQSGTTAKAYILARRLETAADRLRKAGGARKLSITQLALSLGFNDAGYFSQVFREEFGVTPTEFLRRHRLSV